VGRTWHIEVIFCGNLKVVSLALSIRTGQDRVMYRFTIYNIHAAIVFAPQCTKEMRNIFATNQHAENPPPRTHAHTRTHTSQPAPCPPSRKQGMPGVHRQRTAMDCKGWVWKGGLKHNTACAFTSHGPVHSVSINIRAPTAALASGGQGKAPYARKLSYTRLYLWQIHCTTGLKGELGKGIT